MKLCRAMQRGQNPYPRRLLSCREECPDLFLNCSRIADSGSDTCFSRLRRLRDTRVTHDRGAGRVIWGTELVDSSPDNPTTTHPRRHSWQLPGGEARRRTVRDEGVWVQK